MLEATTYNGFDHINSLKANPLLTEEEEFELSRRCKNGDRQAMEQLAECNMRLVISIAKVSRGNLTMEDAIQEGAIGLMQAVKRFDPDKGFRFSTYATFWIRQAIGRARPKAYPIPVSAETELRIRRFRKRIDADDRAVNADAIADKMGISVAEARQLIADEKVLRKHISLSTPVDGPGSKKQRDLGSFIKDGKTAEDDSDAFELLRKLVEELPADLREPLVLQAFGELELKQIAKRLDIPDRLVRDRLERARKLLRRQLRETGAYR